MARARACSLPADSHLASHLPRVDFLDSWSISARPDERPLPEVYASIWSQMPPAFRALMHLRNLLVRPFGLRGVATKQTGGDMQVRDAYGRGDRLGRWNLYEQQPSELILGLDDRHLDFRVSLWRGEVAPGAQRIIVSTAVMWHNVWGRLYLFSILPFHKIGVASLLNRAARRGAI